MRVRPEKTILLLILCLLAQNPAYSAEKSSFEEKLIGSTFKSLARVFVATTNIRKLKESNLKKLQKMDEAKFRKQYVLAYPVINNLPTSLKEKYGVKETMDKAQAIKNTESLDKKKMYELINNIPDATITRLFKQYLRDTKQSFMKSNTVEQIKKFWNKTIRRAN